MAAVAGISLNFYRPAPDAASEPLLSEIDNGDGRFGDTVLESDKNTDERNDIPAGDKMRMESIASVSVNAAFCRECRRIIAPGRPIPYL